MDKKITFTKKAYVPTSARKDTAFMDEMIDKVVNDETVAMFDLAGYFLDCYPKDRIYQDRARTLLSECVQQGYTPAMVALAKLHIKEGTKLEDAKALLERAEDLEDTEAVYWLALRELGQWGTAVGFVSSHGKLEKACRMGQPDALMLRAESYAYGSNAYPQDIKLAVRDYKAAVRAGAHGAFKEILKLEEETNTSFFSTDEDTYLLLTACHHGDKYCILHYLDQLKEEYEEDEIIAELEKLFDERNVTAGWVLSDYLNKQQNRDNDRVIQVNTWLLDYDWEGEAALRIGDVYLDMTYEGYSFEKGAKYMRLAERHGNSYAFSELVEFTEILDYIYPEEHWIEKTAELIEEGIELGDVKTIALASVRYYYGYRLPMDKQKAERILREFIQKNSGELTYGYGEEIVYNLAVILRDKVGVSSALAFLDQYMPLFQHGYWFETMQLLRISMMEEAGGEGIQELFDEWIKIKGKAMLPHYLYYAITHEDYSQHGPDELIDCLRKDINTDWSCYYLGLLRLEGKYVEKDVKKGAMLIQKAANLNMNEALYRMSKLYLEGVCEVPNGVLPTDMASLSMLNCMLRKDYLDNYLACREKFGTGF